MKSLINQFSQMSILENWLGLLFRATCVWLVLINFQHILFWFLTFSACVCIWLCQDKIYMYGGKIDSTGNVTSELWVFHIHNQSWVLLNPRAKEQYAVVGHSAHTVQLQPDGSEPVILVVFGHCPLYGYISQVQQYNIGQQHTFIDIIVLIWAKPGLDVTISVS